MICNANTMPFRSLFTYLQNVWASTYKLEEKRVNSKKWNIPLISIGIIDCISIFIKYLLSFCNARNTPLFKRKIGIHNYAMLCFPPVIYSVCCGWFTFYKYKNVLSICICLYHSVVSCYLCLNTQSTKTLTPTSRVQYSPTP